MLYRAAGSPAAEDGDDEGFADVQDDAYYAEAVKWAKEPRYCPRATERISGRWPV